MICRWVALGVVEAQRAFHLVKGHAQLSVLLAALRPKPKMDEQRNVA